MAKLFSKGAIYAGTKDSNETETDRFHRNFQ